MGNYLEKLTGIIGSLFQLGTDGPQLRNNAGNIEHRDQTNTVFVISRALSPAGDNDLVDRMTFYNVFANPNNPYVYCYENVSLYPDQGSPQGANEIDFLRVWIPGNRTITKMMTFIQSGANGTRRLQMGIYNQATPTSISGVPNTLVASTANQTPAAGANGTYFSASLSASYTTPSSGGFYWLALQVDNATMAFALSANFQAGYANRIEATPASYVAGTLPTYSSLTVSQPKSALVLIAAVE